MDTDIAVESEIHGITTELKAHPYEISHGHFIWMKFRKNSSWSDI